MSQKELAVEALWVRLKPYDPRRGFVLRRFTYQGLRFHEERGWYVVEKVVAEYLRTVQQRESSLHAPLAFEVATEDEASALDAREENEARTRKNATEAPRVAPGRGDLTGENLRVGGRPAVAAPSTMPTTTPTAPTTVAPPRPEADKAKKDRV